MSFVVLYFERACEIYVMFPFSGKGHRCLNVKNNVFTSVSIKVCALGCLNLAFVATLSNRIKTRPLLVHIVHLCIEFNKCEGYG